MATFDAGRRSSASELMDGDGVDYETFRGCLADLARVNRLSFGYRPTLAFLESLRRRRRLPQRRALRVVDVGSGYGDMLREIAVWAKSRSIDVDLVGVDSNPWAEKAAAEATEAGAPIRFRTEDAFAYRPEEPPDVIVSALFTHHLGDEALARFIAMTEAEARIGWFVNDLHRKRFAFHGFALGSRLLRMHPFVQHDGPVSFARSFVAEDWRRALAAAGVPAGAAKTEPWFPFRLCVARVKPS
jgi:SAM-dependent methyltransferase